jgi:LysR family transcriptional regulator, low CO2-responsive transcriptional regulator
VDEINMEATSLNLDALQAFSVFADCLNFSEAALRLHISQPALHVKVRKLAERLERPLYQRQGRQLVLTPTGTEAARFGRETRARTLEFCRELDGHSQPAPLRLVAGEGAYLYLLGKGIQKFQRSPKNQLQLSTANAAEALQSVRNGHSDLGISALDAAPKELTAHRFCEVGQVLAVPSTHPLARKKTLMLSALIDCPLIVPSQERPHRVMLARMLQSAGVSMNIAIEANGWELMLHFVQLGLGAAVVNACCRMPKGVVGVPLPELPSVHYWLFHRADGSSKARLKHFVDTLIEHLDMRWKR